MDVELPDFLFLDLDPDWGLEANELSSDESVSKSEQESVLEEESRFLVLARLELDLFCFANDLDLSIEGDRHRQPLK